MFSILVKGPHKGVEGMTAFARHHSHANVASFFTDPGLLNSWQDSSVHQRRLSGARPAANHKETSFRQSQAVENLPNLRSTPEEHPSVFPSEVQQAGIRRAVFVDVPGDSARCFSFLPGGFVSFFDCVLVLCDGGENECGEFMR